MFQNKTFYNHEIAYFAVLRSLPVTVLEAIEEEALEEEYMDFFLRSDRDMAAVFAVMNVKDITPNTIATAVPSPPIVAWKIFVSVHLLQPLLVPEISNINKIH